MFRRVLEGKFFERRLMGLTNNDESLSQIQRLHEQPVNLYRMRLLGAEERMQPGLMHFIASRNSCGQSESCQTHRETCIMPAPSPAAAASDGFVERGGTEDPLANNDLISLNIGEDEIFVARVT